MIIHGNKVVSTQTNDYNDKIHFKGYFVEYQSVDVSDISVNDPITDLSNSYFSPNNNSWNFISFNTVTFLVGKVEPSSINANFAEL